MSRGGCWILDRYGSLVLESRGIWGALQSNPLFARVHIQIRPSRSEQGLAKEAGPNHMILALETYPQSTRDQSIAWLQRTNLDGPDAPSSQMFIAPCLVPHLRRVPTRRKNASLFHRCSLVSLVFGSARERSRSVSLRSGSARMGFESAFLDRSDTSSGEPTGFRCAWRALGSGDIEVRSSQVRLGIPVD